MQEEKEKLDEIMDHGFVIDQYEAILQMHKVISLLVVENIEMKALLKNYGVY